MYYSMSRSVSNRLGVKTIAELTNYLSETNPMKFRGTHEFYKAKICRMLMALFTGMKADSIWNGYDEAHGGYIVVREDGQVLCYHLNNRNKYEEYLYNHTYLETYGKRSKFAVVERDVDGLIFKLNLDIRMSSGGNVKKDKRGPNSSEQSSLGDF